MSNDRDFDFDDADAPQGAGEAENFNGKPSLKEIWDSTPALKIGALVLGGVLVFAGYSLAFPNHDNEQAKAVVSLGSTESVKQIPGQTELDPVYRQALEEQNQKAAEQAAETGGSALPTPVNTAKTGGLDVPAAPETTTSDPLSEWRKATEARRTEVAPAPVETPAASPLVTVAPAPMEAPVPAVMPIIQPPRQEAQFRQDPNYAQGLAEQMRVIVAAQAPDKALIQTITPVPSAYSKQKAEEEKMAQLATVAGGTTGASSASSATPAETSLPIVSAGTIVFGQLLNELNSDIAGPVLVQILSGPLAGGRAIGSIELSDEYLVLRFTRVVKDAVTYQVDAIAMDQNTTLTGMATDVDRHYFSRIILPAAAKFVEGYSSSVAERGTTTTQTSGGGQSTSVPIASPKQSLYKGLEELGAKAGEVLDDDASQKAVTVKVAKGTTMGVLFLNTVSTTNAQP